MQNLYVYVGNNPVNYVDPSGHEAVCTTRCLDSAEMGGCCPPNSMSWTIPIAGVMAHPTITKDMVTDYRKFFALMTQSHIVTMVTSQWSVVGAGLNRVSDVLTDAGDIDEVRKIASEALGACKAVTDCGGVVLSGKIFDAGQLSAVQITILDAKGNAIGVIQVSGSYSIQAVESVMPLAQHVQSTTTPASKDPTPSPKTPEKVTAE